jgi:hypothetical protein
MAAALARTSQSSKVNYMRDLSHREMKSVAISSRTMDLSDTYLWLLHTFMSRITRRSWGCPWASTLPSRCWHARSAPRRDRKIGFMRADRNGFPA